MGGQGDKGPKFGDVRRTARGWRRGSGAEIHIVLEKLIIKRCIIVEA